MTLEAIRAVTGPLRVLSGYRTEAYNRRVGGARASQHVQGRAADIYSATLSPGQIHDRVLELYRAGELPYLGGLGYYGPSTKGVGFVHVDVRPGTRLARWDGSRPNAENA